MTLSAAYKAVIFDLDGTLLDTLTDIATSMNHALNGLGLPGHEPEAYKLFVGEGSYKLAERALPEDRRDPETISFCEASFLAFYEKHWRDATQPYHGIPELVTRLHGSQIRMGVLSNKPDDFVHRCVDAFFLRDTFDMVRGAAPGMPKKPNPSTLTTMLERMALSVRQVVFVGDTGIDMRTGRSAGAFVVGVTWGFRDEDELYRDGAEALIHQPRELLRYLGMS
ncbi:HAD family hydrolase [Sulfidibacter corallicola]|uniref:phosphoglycolate phosphatase n=1 Tax=Sulfidibacter corallicola TaxID=2818388 RepID=A0A8A4TK74_SULCO|nr:HAD family hydrolase [Sulfidibacter corallicola]QTD49983.1 HAD family hydrolase [Sulfidibacter corallicola]